LLTDIAAESKQCGKQKLQPEEKESSALQVELRRGHVKGSSASGRARGVGGFYTIQKKKGHNRDLREKERIILGIRKVRAR